MADPLTPEPLVLAREALKSCVWKQWESYSGPVNEFHFDHKLVAAALAALSAPPAAAVQPMTDAQIRDVFMRHGFTVKPGQTDLKPYVYEAARALLALAAPPAAQAPASTAVADDARDAARYRWLREQSVVTAQAAFWNYTSRKARDHAIDAFMETDATRTIRADIDAGGQPR